jgi:hypothetical protein
MQVEIIQGNVIYGGKTYDPKSIKVTISLRNRYKGNLRMIPLILFYVVVFATIFTTSIQNLLSDYFLPMWIIYTLSFFWIFNKIRFKYYMEFATIQFDNERKLRLLYSQDRKALVDRLASIAGSVDYIHS